LCALAIPQRARPEFARPLGHLIGGLGELRPHRGRHIEHFEAFGLEARFLEKLLRVLNSFFRAQISFQEMALAFQSPGDENRVGPLLKRFQEVNAVNLARAQKANHPHVR